MACVLHGVVRTYLLGGASLLLGFDGVLPRWHRWHEFEGLDQELRVDIYYAGM